MERNLICITLSGLMLSACTATGYLQSGSPNTMISGKVTREAFGSRRVEITLNDKIYRGEWRVDSPTKEQKAETSYPHQRHIGVVNSTLRAEDGSTLECHWKTESNTAEGSCLAGRQEYLLNMM
ncbi:exported hypothetical protein [Candidatus Propionivibrio aalborgensis]|uniref:Lipoprotein n=1 Tax=Candidatus Propionivibrio aalborgensis TaxID=1860101 RepID=A0A1A8Y0E6_9RHOO|nr:hypothetical protein [Candidatus Propionivibrio aalborgensis]SBT10426.1 exported hypothetical protein [Candidatus Propionivibrio aalborgensis]